jgi:hypothetical protein
MLAQDDGHRSSSRPDQKPTRPNTGWFSAQNVSLGAIVLSGVIHPAGTVDWTALRWHVGVWDPWFPVRGILLALAAPGYSRRTSSAGARCATLGGGGIGEHEASAVAGGGGIEEQATAVFGGGGTDEQDASAVAGGGGIEEHEASAVSGGGGIAEHEASAVSGGGGIAEHEASAVTGGGGMSDPERAGRRALADAASLAPDSIPL